MNERIIPWGTIVAGAVALATAVVVGLVHVGGWTVPFQTAGPGAVIVIGVLIVLAGLLAVFRSTRSAAAREGITAPATGAAAPVLAPPSAPSPTTLSTLPEDVPAAQGAAAVHPVEGPDGDAAQSSH